MSDKTTTIEELKDLEEKFKKDRNWQKHHTPRNIAASIVIEAAELLEHFQWGKYSQTPETKEEIAKELADVILYCLSFSVATKIDIATAVKEKVEHNSKKYPVHLFNAKRDDPKEYQRRKKGYRRRGQ